MITFAFALCGIILVSYILLFSRWDKIRITAGSLLVVSGITLIPLFYKVQKENGNPDFGKEFEQLYFPLGVFAISVLVGIITLILSIKRYVNKNQQS